MSRSIVWASLFSLSILPARAVEAEPLDLVALLAEADRASPGVQARLERAAAASEMATRVEVPPDPLLSVSYTNDGLDELTLGDSPFSNVTVRWDQELPRKAARRGAGEVARKESSVYAAQADRLRAGLRRRVLASYVSIWRTEHDRALLEEGRAVLVAALEAARAR